MDFPPSLHEKPREWARRDSISSTSSSGSQLESPPPVGNHSFASCSPMEIDMRDKKTVEPYGVESTNQESTHGFRSEKLVKSAAQATLTHHTLTSRVGSSNTHSGQVANINVNIEWDVLESFTEFATFLELQNPICPAELLDTPEKLMNVLVWQHFRAH